MSLKFIEEATTGNTIFGFFGAQVLKSLDCWNHLERVWIEETSEIKPWGITMFKNYKNEKG